MTVEDEDWREMGQQWRAMEDCSTDERLQQEILLIRNHQSKAINSSQKKLISTGLTLLLFTIKNGCTSKNEIFWKHTNSTRVKINQNN